MYKKIFLFTGLLFLLIYSCKTGKKSENPGLKESWYEYLPPRTGYVFVFNKKINLNNFSSSIFNYYVKDADKKFLSKFSFSAPFYFYILQKDDKLKSFVAIGISTDFDKIFHKIDGVYNGVNIYTASFLSKNFYGFKRNESFFVSDSRVNLENIIRKEKEQQDNEKLEQYKEADRLLDHHAEYNFIQISEDLKPDLFSASGFQISPQQLSSIEAFDAMDLSKQIYTGITLSHEKKMMDIFNDISGVNDDVYNFIPEGFTKVSRLSFDDFVGFYSGFTTFFNYQPLIKYTTKSLFQTLHSITYSEENFNKSLILHFDDPSDFIKNNPYSGSYNAYDIYEVKDTSLLYTLFKPILKPFRASFFTFSDDYIIITENKAYLKKLINDFENRNTLVNRKDFHNFSDLFPSEAQYEILQQRKINNKKYYIYRNYKKDDENVYVNLLLKKQNDSKRPEGIEHLLTVSMDDTPIIKPQLVYNHKHKTYRIIYQNQNNELVYMDLSGQVLWKKKYEDKIIGKIRPVDLYRNGKIQYAFVTNDKWYIIDRYGRNVEGFPINFRKDITQDLSVFDYDKNRKYRFGIVQGKKFTLFDKEGKKIKGFEYKPTGEISFPVNHYRIKNKDFILIQTKDGKLHILNRRGEIRIPIEQQFDNLVSNWKVYNSKFINLTKDNILYTIDVKGKLKKAKLGYNKPLKFDAIPKLFAAVVDDNVILNNQTFSLELGAYNKPYLFKNKKGKLLSFISREDNNKIYIYHPNGKQTSFSPITGQQILDVKALGSKNYLLSYDSERNLMIYRFK